MSAANTASPLGRSLLAAAIIIAVSAALAWLAPVYISTELSHRLLGAMLGAVVVVYADAIPKALVARARRRCTAAQDQAARRFAGWALVLGGLGYSTAWLLAPFAMAGLIGGAVLAFALILAVLRCVRTGAGNAPS
ncbi:hypothetical protein [Massilia sp. TWP1-3-3]|uniref:hypothetical protein n=1 Tax=Massilia sp. TWP1-3-3 TaxID=2804573 RepID=UPI003CE7ED6A